MCQSVETKHTFEQSGLGLAPFKIVSKSEGNGAFYCEHCGTMLKNRFFVKSSDGKVSVVGVDCLKKTDDVGLLEGVKRIQKAIRAEKRMQAQEDKSAKCLQRQRDLFGGKTHEEVRLEYLANIESVETQLELAVEESDLYLELNKSDFGYSMLGKLSSEGAISDNMKRICIEILAKQRSSSRKNSKKYNAAYESASNDMADLIASLLPLAAKRDALRQSMYEHNAKYHALQ
ncbi:hypothetical protein AB4254_10935 [Vibrio breoganii]